MKQKDYLVQNFETPILLIVFNRPETTLKILEAVKLVKPKRIFVACDGPRAGNLKDHQGVKAVRDLITSFVDWECEVKTNFQDKNLGCKLGVSSAITWFFNQVEEGIILEDDCLPEKSFFLYCQEMLNRYRDNDKVMMISGDCFAKNTGDIPESYFFTSYIYIWGWATWKRAWAKYDISMKGWPERRQVLNQKLQFKDHIWKTYSNGLDGVYFNGVDTWDYQWLYTCWKENGLGICPTKNLITNIGFGVNATHTHNAESALSMLTTYPLIFPLVHPKKVERNFEMEKRSEKVVFPHSTFIQIKKVVKVKLKLLYEKFF